MLAGDPELGWRGSYQDYWLDRTKNKYHSYLVGQPVAKVDHAAFVYTYARMNMAAIRQDPLWAQEFKDRNAMYAAWSLMSCYHVCR